MLSHLLTSWIKATSPPVFGGERSLSWSVSSLSCADIIEGDSDPSSTKDLFRSLIVEWGKKTKTKDFDNQPEPRWYSSGCLIAGSWRLSGSKQLHTAPERWNLKLNTINDGFKFKPVMITYICKPVNPSRDTFSSQSRTNIITEMIAIFIDKMIHITVVVSNYAFHECPKFGWSHVNITKNNGASVFKPWTTFRFNFEYATCRVFMGAISVF